MRLRVQNHLAQQASPSLLGCTRTRLVSILPPRLSFPRVGVMLPEVCYDGGLPRSWRISAALWVFFWLFLLWLMSLWYQCAVMGAFVFLLFVCVRNLKGKNMETEGRMSLQVCLEANQMVHFSSDAFWFSVQELQNKNRMPSFCKGLLMWLFLVLLVQKAIPGLGCIDSLVAKEFTHWH